MISKPSKNNSFKFSELADNISERVEPDETDLKVYVGLEHLDPESIHISRHGTPDEVEGIKLKAYPGDVIFGKRRAYQRKAAVMVVPGICSAHAMVLRARPKVILPGLFPFLLHSDAFMNTAVRISEGSLSPTIKWKSLAEQVFSLPEIGKQKEALDLLSSVDTYSQSLAKLRRELSTFLDSLLVRIFSDSSMDYKDQDLIKLKLSQIAVEAYGIVDGPFGSNLKRIHYRKSGIPIMQSGYVTKGYFKTTDSIFVDPEKYKSEIRSSTKSGDILISKIGMNYGECAIIPPGFEKAILAGNAMKITVDSTRYETKYVLYFLKFLKKQGVFKKLVTTTAQPALSISVLKEIQIRIPKSLDTQKKIVKEIEDIENAISLVTTHLSCNNKIQANLINTLFAVESQS